MPTFHDPLRVDAASVPPPGPAGAPEGPFGGAAGTRGTSGEPGGTSGRPLRAFWRRDRPVLIGVWVALAVFALVNSLSVAEDRAGQVLGWEPWVWEWTSCLAMVPVAPVIGLLALSLRPPTLPRWAALLLHPLAATLVSLVHVGAMVALRRAVYAAAAHPYGFVFDSPTLVYEWRKDLLTYTFIALVFAGWDRLRRPGPSPQSEPEPSRLVVRDGARTHLIAPAEIAWAQAAGNYVELFTTRGAVLHRTSLAALEAELGPHGFARVHRSRLVRLAAVRAVATTPSGDFTATLADGTMVGGSRRYRAAIPR